MENIIKKKKFVVIYYSESKEQHKRYFTNNYLWSDSIFNNFAIIEESCARKLISFRESKKIFQRITRDIKKKKVVSMHLGAGASISSGLLPTGILLKLSLKQLLNSEEDNLYILKKMFIEKKNPDVKIEEITLELVMSTMKKEKMDLPNSNALSKFRRKMEEIESLSIGYHKLHELSKKYRTVLTTTNFDNFCDKSVEKPYSLVIKEDYDKANGDNIINTSEFNLISKLHGDIIKSPNYLGILLETNMQLRPEIEQFFTTFLRGKHVSDQSFDLIFIGYSFSDKDILKVLRNEITNGQGKYTPIIVSPTGGINIKKIINWEEWKEYLNEPVEIHMSFDRFMEELYKFLI